MMRKKLLVLGLAAGSYLALPGALAQDAETQPDLDITLSVVEDTQDAQDLLNSIELPPELQEMAEQQLAAVMAAVEAARQKGDQQGSHSGETEAIVAEALARSRETTANNIESANAAVADAQLAAEAAREAIEEAVKNGLTGAEVEGIIEQMMQDILASLPEDIREQMPADIGSIIEDARNNASETPDG